MYFYKTITTLNIYAFWKLYKRWIFVKYVDLKKKQKHSMILIRFYRVGKIYKIMDEMF
jgi:hypothetical protein